MSHRTRSRAVTQALVWWCLRGVAPGASVVVGGGFAAESPQAARQREAEIIATATVLFVEYKELSSWLFTDERMGGVNRQAWG